MARGRRLGRRSRVGRQVVTAWEVAKVRNRPETWWAGSIPRSRGQRLRHLVPRIETGAPVAAVRGGGPDRPFQGNRPRRRVCPGGRRDRHRPRRTRATAVASPKGPAGRSDPGNRDLDLAMRPQATNGGRGTACTGQGAKPVRGVSEPGVGTTVCAPEPAIDRRLARRVRAAGRTARPGARSLVVRVGAPAGAFPGADDSLALDVRLGSGPRQGGGLAPATATDGAGLADLAGRRPRRARPRRAGRVRRRGRPAGLRVLGTALPGAGPAGLGPGRWPTGSAREAASRHGPARRPGGPIRRPRGASGR